MLSMISNSGNPLKELMTRPIPLLTAFRVVLIYEILSSFVPQ